MFLSVSLLHNLNVINFQNALNVKRIDDYKMKMMKTMMTQFLVKTLMSTDVKKMESGKLGSKFLNVKMR